MDAKNLAEQLIYTSEKSLNDAGEKVPAEVKTEIEAKITDLKKVKDGSDLAAIKTATEELSKNLSKIGEAMNKATGEQKPPENPEGNVRDAETNS